MLQVFRNTILAGALAVASCAPLFGGGKRAIRDTSNSDIHIRVANRNWSDVTVYALVGSSRMRLGTVISMSEQIFVLPRAVSASTGELRLLIDPIGTWRGYMTEAIMAFPGQVIELNVENNLGLTNWAVW